MTDEELIAYFKAVELPNTLRLDRASTQLNVKGAVERNLQTMNEDSKDMRCRHRLRMIAHALEQPYTGQGIPRL